MHKRRKRLGRFLWTIIGLVLVAALASGFLFLKNTSAQPRTAPEAERVLAAQSQMPFQVLIPAYLPSGFDRSQVQIDTSLAGPGGEPMVQLVYSTRKDFSLTLQEWYPLAQGVSSAAENSTTAQPEMVRCNCQCRSRSQCDLSDLEAVINGLHVNLKFSVSGVVSAQIVQLILETLGPAANQQIYSSIEDVPVTYSVPPAVEVPINAGGVQEITLVVTPQGYNPVHFAVKRGVPVRLIFRQVGYVGCGNELIFQWGAKQKAELRLASSGDTQILEFTPMESGDFPFNCPHLIYRGLMTVKD